MIELVERLFRPSQPELSEARAGDAAAMAELHSASFHRGWSEVELESLLADRNVIAHRAIAGRKLVGFILSRRAADEAEILSLAVAASRRGHGVARQLLGLHLSCLAGLLVKAVFLEVDPDNTPAVRLYRRAGFQEVGQRPGYYAQTGRSAASALVLRRDLS